MCPYACVVERVDNIWASEAVEQYERAIKADAQSDQVLEFDVYDNEGAPFALGEIGSATTLVWEIVHGKLKQVLGEADHPVGCTVDVAGDKITVHIIRAAMWDQMTKVGVVTDVGFLHVLRDQILSGDFERDLTRQLVNVLKEREGEEHEGKVEEEEEAKVESRNTKLEEGELEAIELKSNVSSFLSMYDINMLRLKNLTPHQAGKMRECHREGELLPFCDTHIQAPAGGGKSFLGMHIADNLLAGDPDAMVLFAATNLALCFFFMNWICTRRAHPEAIEDVLQRLHMLTEDGESKTTGSLVLQKFEIRDGLLELVRMDRAAKDYTLLIVDEAHHLYPDVELRKIVEAHTGSRTRRVFLSDVSQWTTADVGYPSGMQDVILDQVVRSSQRIVAAARAFQTNVNAAVQTTCLHQSDGPALVTRMFDTPNDGLTRRSAYTDHVVKAVDTIRQKYPRLNLHNRVAILGPDEAFVGQLREDLSEVLGSKLGFMDAAAANRVLTTTASLEEAEAKDFG